MFISKICNLLDAQKVAKAVQLIESAKFVDGRISGGNEDSKKNLELAPETERYIEVLNIVEIAVRESLEFSLTAFPRYMTRPIISRYEIGMYYKEHVDMPVMGFISGGKPVSATRGLTPLGRDYVRSDLSMTLFLTQAESYDGGELCFDNQLESIRLKMDAGSAVLYPTGVRHSVAPVTRGIRLAAIFWIQTMFPVEAHRKAIYDARRLMQWLNQGTDTAAAALAEENFYNLFRLFAEI